MREPRLSQIPGIFMCVDKENKISYCNDHTLLLVGFNDISEAIGVHHGSIPCKASECVAIFDEQNKKVVEDKTTLTILDIHPYRNNKIHMLLTNKSPCYDPKNNVAGVIINGMEITHKTLLNVGMTLATTDKQYRTNKNVNQRNYKISKDFKKSNLTNREIECLFYLVRGKTAQTISNLLNISKRTVEKHLVNIKYKLACKTKSDLIEKAIDSHFIDYIPENIFKKSTINISVII